MPLHKMHFFYIKQQLQAEVWGEVNDLVYSICKHSKYLMELQNKIVQDAFIMLPLPLLHMHAKRSPIYSTDSEHTYNWAMVYSAEVLKARSGIRNNVLWCQTHWAFSKYCITTRSNTVRWSNFIAFFLDHKNKQLCYKDSIVIGYLISNMWPLTSLAAYVYSTLFFITNHRCFHGFLLPLDLCR